MYRIIFILLFSVLGAHEGHDHDHDEDHENVIHLSAEQIEDAQIETAVAAPAQLYMTINIPAKIVLNQDRHAHVVAKASGIVKKITKNLGDSLKEGEILAVLESKEVAEAKAAYLSSYKKSELAHQMLASEEVLKNKKISPEQDYLQASQAAREAAINLEVAKQALFTFGMSEQEINDLPQNKIGILCTYEIKAPLSGMVTAKDISLGELVPEDKEIFTIADLNTVWVELGVFPQALSAVKPGKKIFVRPIKGVGPQATATIIHMSPVIDEETKTAPAIALLSNSTGQWYPGTYACASVIVDEKSVPIAVLNDALQNIDGETCLFVLHPEGFEKQCVQTGATDGKYTEITKGLEPGTQYASKNTFLLKAQHGVAEAGHDH